MYCTVCGCDISAVWWWFRRWMLVITHCISRRWSVVTIPKKIRYLVWGNPLIFNILKMHLEIYCLYLGNIEMCCMFKVYCLLLYFSQNSIYFIILSFCVQVIYFLKPWVKIQITTLVGWRLTSRQLVWHLIFVHCLKNVIWTEKWNCEIKGILWKIQQIIYHGLKMK
jgi:hypothetical protein